jgi:hypothetical protein
MKSFMAFDLYDYLIILGIVIVAIVLFIILVNKIYKGKIDKKPFSKRKEISKIIIGILLIIISIAGYVVLEKSQSDFLPGLGCQPIVFSIITVFISGLMLILLGIIKISRNGKS